MPNLDDLQAQLQQVRQNLYDCFKGRSDTLMELLDAIASNSNARSPAELSLNPLFHRDYSAQYTRQLNISSNLAVWSKRHRSNSSRKNNSLR